MRASCTVVSGSVDPNSAQLTALMDCSFLTLAFPDIWDPLGSAMLIDYVKRRSVDDLFPRKGPESYCSSNDSRPAHLDMYI